jgi:hypothetical protein
MRQLWRKEAGRLGSIGADDIWRGHGQTWEQYLAINAGLLDSDRGRSAMRWIESHYGFEPHPGIHLLACSDWWPIRWSTQWIAQLSAPISITERTSRRPAVGRMALG